MVRHVLALAVLGLATTAAWADIPVNPRPGPRPQPQPPGAGRPVPFLVEVDANAKEPRLIVPRRLVNLRAGLDIDGDEQLGDAGARPGTVVAGVALALGVGCGGFWLARRTRGTGLAVAAGLCLVGSAVAWANVAPPPRRPEPPAAVTELFNGKVPLEVTAQGDTIKLIVTPDMLTKLQKPAGAPGVGSAPPPEGAAPAAQPKPE